MEILLTFPGDTGVPCVQTIRSNASTVSPKLAIHSSTKIQKFRTLPWEHYYLPESNKDEAAQY